ncbi:MAG: helix-turn-helix domain-containing protein [Flavonifractor plautii]
MEIGSSVGVSRVTVSRVLGDFDRRGWVGRPAIRA